MNDSRRTVGFTIVELLIVIVVIGILAAITIVAFNGVSDRAKVALVKSDLSNAATQLGTDNANNGVYPSSVAASNNGQGLKASAGTAYQYTYSSIDNSYCLTAINGSTAYNYSSTSGVTTSGVCPGHIPPGGSAGNAVTTFAGTPGVTGYADGTGTAAKFANPEGLAIDGSGNVFVTEYTNNRIRKITSAGVVTTFAGSGAAGFGDATGTAAVFNAPRDVVVDSSGNLFVADTGNNRIRKITSAGVVTTFAGSSYGFTNATGTSAQFATPTGIAIDSSNNLYVADSGNNVIRKITTGGVVTTFAGSGTSGASDGTGTAAQFASPNGLTADSSGNVFVMDTFNYKIRKINSGGVVTTLAGSGASGNTDGTGAAAQFSNARDIAVDSSGNLIVPDTSNNTIRKVTSSGVVTTLAGASVGINDGTGTSAQFSSPIGITIDGSGVIYISDYNGHTIRKVQ